PWISSTANANLTIHLKPNKEAYAKLDIKNPGSTTYITLKPPSGWKIVNSSIEHSDGQSSLKSPDNFNNPVDEAKYSFKVYTTSGLTKSVAVSYSGTLVHPGGHGGGKLPTFT